MNTNAAADQHRGKKEKKRSGLFSKANPKSKLVIFLIVAIVLAFYQITFGALEFLKAWGEYGHGPGEFWCPRGIAIDASNNVYVADCYNNRVQKFDNEGNYLLQWEFPQPSSIEADHSGNVWVASDWACIYKFDNSGNEHCRVASIEDDPNDWGSEPGQFRYSEDLAVDSNDNVYIVDSGNSRIQKFTSDCEYLGLWEYLVAGKKSAGLHGLVIDSNDVLYVTHSIEDSVIEYDTDGNLLGRWSGSTGHELVDPQNIAIDKQNRLYIVDTWNFLVQIYDTAGNYLDEFGSGTGSSTFYGPDGIAVDNGGNVFVADTWNHEVQKFGDTAPQVVSITRTDTDPTAASSVGFIVTFTKNVTGVDTGDFHLTATGTASGNIASVSGSGSSYTVTLDAVAGDGTLRLDIIDDDSIVDSSVTPNVPLGGAGPQNYTGGELYTIDNTPPAVVSINRADADPTNATSVDFTVTFSETVTGVDAGDFTLSATGTASGTIASVSGSGNSYTVTVDTVAGDGTLRLDIDDDDSIIDGVGNPLGGSGEHDYTGGQAYTIVNTVDNTPPEINSITRADANPTNAASVNFTVTFSETVTGVDTADFALTKTGTASGNVASVSGSGTIYTVTVDTVSGDGTLRLDISDNDSIVDGAGNPLGGTGAQNYTSGQLYVVDNTPPAVGSITRADANPTIAASVNFTMTFSETVTGVDTADFALTKTGTAAGNVASVSGSGNTYTVTVDTVSGDGTLRLDIADNDSIVDGAGNPLGGTGAQNYTSGQLYDIDNTPRPQSLP